MRLHEYEAADIFEIAGIPVPRRMVVESAEEALSAAGKIGYPVVVKAQVLVGGRGLAGGIQTADSPEALEIQANQLLGSEIKGLPVHKLLIAEKAEMSVIPNLRIMGSGIHYSVKKLIPCFVFLTGGCGIL